MNEHEVLTLLQLATTFLAAVGASSGFWLFLERNRSKRDLTNKLLLGIAHDRILRLALEYLERGDWITGDEYENLHKFLYLPYKELGGNGSTDRIMIEIDKLRIIGGSIRKTSYESKGESENVVE